MSKVHKLMVVDSVIDEILAGDFDSIIETRDFDDSIADAVNEGDTLRLIRDSDRNASYDFIIESVQGTDAGTYIKFSRME